jgi:antitoxin HigA-1
MTFHKITPIAHPRHFLKRELTARGLSANRLALDIGVPSRRMTDMRRELCDL